MEYLMTYGWAILILAIILGALAQLGVFSNLSFAPRATPGSCQIMRSQFYPTSLQGACQGALPQYVAKFKGQGDYVSATLPTSSPITLSFWYNRGAFTSTYFHVMNKGSTRFFQIYSPSSAPYLAFKYVDSIGNPYEFYLTSSNQPASTWIYVSATLDAGGTFNGYINGVNSRTYTSVGILGLDTNSLQMSSGDYNGTMANVQVYNTSLSANEINSLYLKGIGGAPIDLQHIVGWWPLNGDTKDYSGNNNNGAPSGGTFTNSYGK